MATKTADMALSRVSPRGNHNGVDAVRCTLSLGAVGTISAGDVVLWGKVPHGSTLLAIQTNNSGSPDDDWPAIFHIDGTTLGAASHTCLATGFQGLAGLPFTVSLSGGETPRFSFLKMTAGTITSASDAGALSATMWLTRNAGSGDI
ncbi:MAG: hypothetical protein ACYSX0_20105 [Planctomycetota bacterium]|jgi:hypothetical protein